MEKKEERVMGQRHNVGGTIGVKSLRAVAQIVMA